MGDKSETAPFKIRSKLKYFSHSLRSSAVAFPRHNAFVLVLHSRLACPKLKPAGGAGEGRLGLVFPNGQGRVENHANIANRGFYALQIAVGIVDSNGKPKYGLHALRHFFASWAIEREFSAKRVQALLGHSSIQMTFDVYGHLFPNPEDDHAKFAAGELAVVG